MLYYFVTHIIDAPHNLNRRMMGRVRKICSEICIVSLLQMDDISKSTTQSKKC